MNPDNDNYMFDFRLYNSEAYGGTNYEQNAGMAVVVDGESAYIYVSSAAKANDPAEDNAAAHVACYKLSYSKQQ